LPSGIARSFFCPQFARGCRQNKSLSKKSGQIFPRAKKKDSVFKFLCLNYFRTFFATSPFFGCEHIHPATTSNKVADHAEAKDKAYPYSYPAGMLSQQRQKIRGTASAAQREALRQCSGGGDNTASAQGRRQWWQRGGSKTAAESAVAAQRR
jgi:hypothetical protein